MKFKQQVLICGTMRSGSKYIFKALNHLRPRVAVRHENRKPGYYGITGWTFIKMNPGDFDIIFHQVRDPLKVMSSCSGYPVYFFEDPEGFFPIKYQYPKICDQCLDHGHGVNDGCGHRSGARYLCHIRVLRTMRYWYYMNLAAEKISSWRYHVEDFHNDEGTRKEMYRRLGIPEQQPSPDHLWGGENPERYTMLTWDLLRELDEELASKIWDKCHEYGYPQ